MEINLLEHGQGDEELVKAMVEGIDNLRLEISKLYGKEYDPDTVVTNAAIRNLAVNNYQKYLSYIDNICCSKSLAQKIIYALKFSWVMFASRVGVEVTKENDAFARDLDQVISKVMSEMNDELIAIKLRML